MAEWVDFDLIARIADARRDWTFVLIGDVFTDEADVLQNRPNVHLLGLKPYTDMPLYLYHFDVCTIPFKLNKVTHAVDPVKFYEYMSAGKPTVAVPSWSCSRTSGTSNLRRGRRNSSQGSKRR